MSALHELKTWPDFFDAIKRGDKSFEVRRNDRNFEVDDTLLLLKFDPAQSSQGPWITPSGTRSHKKEHADNLKVQVTYVLQGGSFGIDGDFVVMSHRILNGALTELAQREGVNLP